MLLRIASRVPHLRLAVMAALVGAAAGVAAWLLLHLIGLFTNLFLFHQWGWDVPSFSELQPSPWIVVAAVCGAGVVTLMARWAPVIRGHGIPEAMEAVLVRQSRISPRTAVAKPLSSAIAIGTGGPFGAEGPIIVTGGALGSLLGQLVHVSANERKILLASGAAAGMAATFGTPLAAVVLAIELLLFEFSTRALVPLVVATSVAAAVHAALYGTGPLFAVPTHDFAGLAQFPWYALLGIGCGLLATLIAKGLFAVEHAYRRLPVGEVWHPIIGALIWAPIGLLAPRVLGVGYDVIDDALAGRLAAATLATLAIGKLVVWWIALASGTSGGTLAPILLISSCSGALVGDALHHFVPAVSPTTFALVAMAATFGAATRAPFAAIVFVFELTRDYDAILPLMWRHRARRHVARSTAAREPDDREARPPTRRRPRRVPPRRDVHDTSERDHDHRRGCHAGDVDGPRCPRPGLGPAARRVPGQRRRRAVHRRRGPRRAVGVRADLEGR